MCYYHVSAQELAAENMIKLPIVLAEHPEGWPAAVFGAVQTQRKLEAEAPERRRPRATATCPSCCFRRRTWATKCRPSTAPLPHR